LSDTNAPNLVPITTTQALRDLCGSLSKADFVAIDTEFHRENTYWSILCLIQVASPDVEGIIDPMASGIDMAPLVELLLNPNVTKVFHAARQDLEIFYKICGNRLPSPVFDSQVAAMALGLGDSISYESLVGTLLGRGIDKSSRFTDWQRRPLTDRQLEYAIADVTHLRDLYPDMASKLETAGRTDWLKQEGAFLTDVSLYEADPEKAWERLKVRRYKADYLAALKAVAKWREETAQSRDMPRSRVLKDDAVQEIAEQKPLTEDDFERLRAVPRGFARSRMGQSLIAVLKTVLSNPKSHAPQVERPDARVPSNGPLSDLFKVLLRHVAEKEGVAPRLIASAPDLDRLASDPLGSHPVYEGWRDQVFGRHALALAKGKLALTVQNGTLVIRDIA
jgi:ribonuclease D